MGFNPKSTEDVAQLSKAVGYSRGCLEVFRTNRHEVIREFVGKHYSANGAAARVPINLIELAMNIYLQRLVAKAPAVSVTTEFKQLKEICTRFEIAGNHLIKEINLGNDLEMAVVGAMFSIGIIKVGMNRTKVEIGGVSHDSGQPFADYVSLDDWVHDMTVDKMENGQFEGNFYHLTVDEAKQIFSAEACKNLILQEEQTPQDRDHSVSEGSATQREEFIKTIRLLDLWLPKQNLILQCQATDDDKDPIAAVLNVIEWDGPERGPYHKLGFTKIENNTMPLAPAALWRDLHELANELFRKLGRQAQREKKFGGVRRGGEKDGERIIEANDGDVIILDNPKATIECHTGGISQESLGFLLVVKDLFAYLGGNLDMLGGLGPQSETLGQDQLLSASASMRVQKMQKSTILFTQAVIEDLLFYLWTDPYIILPATKKVKGYDDVTVSAPLHPHERENDFLELNVKIEPYSMQHQTPEAKLQGLRTIFMELIAPFVPMMQAQGITVDFEALFRTIGKLGNLPELNDILIYSSANYEREPVGQMPTKAPVTTRNYTRRSIPGATNQGKSQIMQQALFGGKPQNSEVSSLMRAAG